MHTQHTRTHITYNLGRAEISLSRYTLSRCILRESDRPGIRKINKTRPVQSLLDVISRKKNCAHRDTALGKKEQKMANALPFLFWRNRSGMKIMRRRRAELHLSLSHMMCKCKVAGRVGWRKKVLSCALASKGLIIVVSI
jgi:hypothetical protein